MKSATFLLWTRNALINPVWSQIFLKRSDKLKTFSAEWHSGRIMSMTVHGGKIRQPGAVHWSVCIQWMCLVSQCFDPIQLWPSQHWCLWTSPQGTNTSFMRRTWERWANFTSHLKNSAMKMWQWYNVTWPKFLIGIRHFDVYAPCIILQYVYKPTRCTKFLWLDFIFH